MDKPKGSGLFCVQCYGVLVGIAWTLSQNQVFTLIYALVYALKHPWERLQSGREKRPQTDFMPTRPKKWLFNTSRTSQNLNSLEPYASPSKRAGKAYGNPLSRICAHAIAIEHVLWDFSQELHIDPYCDSSARPVQLHIPRAWSVPYHRYVHREAQRKAMATKGKNSTWRRSVSSACHSFILALTENPANWLLTDCNEWTLLQVKEDLHVPDEGANVCKCEVGNCYKCGAIPLEISWLNELTWAKIVMPCPKLRGKHSAD